MLLRCHELPAVGSVLEFNIKGHNRDPFDLPGEVVRHAKPEKPGGRGGIGVKFIVIPPNVEPLFGAVLKQSGATAETTQRRAVSKAEELPSEDSAKIAKTLADALQLIEQAAPQDACQILQPVLRKFPKDNELRSIFHLAAGLTSRQRGLEEAAHSHFQRALRCNPDSTFILQHLREEA
jgi:hypothetical protein